MTGRLLSRLDGRAGRPWFGPMPSLEREITDFETDVLRRSHERLVLAEFWAPWCVVCQRLHPALEHVVAHYVGRVDLVSVNIEMHAQVLEPQGVHGLPLVKAYFRGRALGELTGVVAEPELQQWVASLFDAARESGLLPLLAAPPAGPVRPPS